METTIPLVTAAQQEEKTMSNLEICLQKVDLNSLIKKNQMRVKEKNHELNVLLIGPIMVVLLSYLCPNDSVELLSCHPDSLRNEDTGWRVMVKMLGLTSVLKRYANPRALALHALRQLGYCCTNCFTALDGPRGFFACTSLCISCSEERFKASIKFTKLLINAK